MKPVITTILVVFNLLWLTAAAADVGYKRTPWGSKSWTGPGRPPHWSPRPSRPHRPVDPGWGVRPPIHRPYRRSRVYYYYEPPAQESVVIEQPTLEPVSTPVPRRLSPLRCGGETVSRRDPHTGELIIEYVTSSRSCSP